MPSSILTEEAEPRRLDSIGNLLWIAIPEHPPHCDGREFDLPPLSALCELTCVVSFSFRGLCVGCAELVGIQTRLRAAFWFDRAAYRFRFRDHRSRFGLDCFRHDRDYFGRRGLDRR